jgi:peptide/nickel transport system ATP-binding protein
MYAGRIVEIGPVANIVARPHHPYTVGLMQSIPQIGHRPDRLRQIDGTMPRLNEIPPGCPFHPRCPLVVDVCRLEEPRLRSVASGHTVACHRAEDALERFEHVRAPEATEL